MAFNIIEDLGAYFLPSLAYFPYSFLAFVFWATIHVAVGYCLASYTTWVHSAATILKENAQKKGKNVKTFSQYESIAKWDLSMKVVAFLHALFASILSFWSLATSDHWLLTYDDLWSTDPTSRFIITLSSGYFLYDFFLALLDFDLAFLVHGTMAFAIYQHAAANNFSLKLGMFFLLYEFSTIFLNIRSIMITTGNGHHRLFGAAELAFFLSFLVFRIIIGLGYSLYNTLPVLISNLFGHPKPPHSYFAQLIFILANIALNFLNILWSSKMLSIATKHLKKPQKAAAAAAANDAAAPTKQKTA